MMKKSFSLVCLILIVSGCAAIHQLGRDLGQIITYLTPEPKPTYGAVLMTPEQLKDREHKKFCEVPEHKDYSICQ